MEYWQRLLEEAEGEVDHIKTYAEEDDDEVGVGVEFFIFFI